MAWLRSCILVALSFACAGPDQVLTECKDYAREGQYTELGSLRDKLIANGYRDPGGAGRVYWCPAFMDDGITRANGIPEWNTGGLYLGCREIYAVDDEQALRRARHEQAHCYAYRLFGNAEPYHGNGSPYKKTNDEHPEFWVAVE